MKAGLPDDKGNWATDDWDGKPEPVVSNTEACESNAWLETCKPSEHEVTDELTAQAAKPEVPGQVTCKTGAWSANDYWSRMIILNPQRFA